MAINWEIDAAGRLVVTLENDEERATLLCELFPYEWDDPTQIKGFPPELIPRYNEIKAHWHIDRNRSWNDIELDVYEPMWTNGFEVHPIETQDIFALWGGPIIAEDVERNDNNKVVDVHGRVWTDNHYVFYNSPAGIDTLAFTGKAIWEPVPMEEQEHVQE